MTFEDLMEVAQDVVDRVSAKEKSDVVIVAAHAGTGNGDGNVLENQGLDLFKSLRGVDFVICAHDHRPVTYQNDSICLVNSGSHCMNLGHGQITLEFENGVLVDKSISGSLIPVDKNKADVQMRNQFYADYKAIKGFTTLEVGTLKTDLVTSDAYKGMSEYLNLLHTLSLGCTPAQLSLAAPLTFNGYVKAGTILFNDLFTIYPYENQLFVVKMTGKEIKDYLEYSYDAWINTIGSSDDILLKITDRPDPRTGQKRWSFVNRSYNFDSAGGLIYSVDVTKPMGQRILIEAMADGSSFAETSEYNVAMTSYRASGGGDIMRKGAGIDTDRISERVVEYYPEIREILYDYLVRNGEIAPEKTGDRSVIGEWKFVPEQMAAKAMERDMALLF
jgi:2',3'-cyclic-nucleotide 2'-phosphodiesterase/3'-nucleotidase